MRPIDKRKKRTQQKPKLVSWLDAIQQDSWQLELVISGIAIFLLLQAVPALVSHGERHSVLLLSGEIFDQLMFIPFNLLLISTYGLIAILIFHLVLRGLWIGAIGLRSVSGGFDHTALRYQPTFDGWLRRRLGTFDDYIERLEKRSSVAFSFAFLLFFSIVGLWLFVNITVFLGLSYFSFIDNLIESNPAYIIPALFPALIWCLFGLMYMVDFVTMGFFKKIKWLQKVYFPIYRLLSWITLSRFYRPLYYNLIDHPVGRQMMWVLVPLVFFTSIVGDLDIGRNPYFPKLSGMPAAVASENYLDEGKKTFEQHLIASLSSRYAKDDYLEVFVPYLGFHHNEIIHYRYPGLTPAKNRSFGFSDFISIYDEEANADSLLAAHSSLHRISLGDSILRNVPWRLYHHPTRQQDGLLFPLPVYNLERGEHCLRFEELRVTGLHFPVLDWEIQATICFMK